jgi:uncharacterized protein (DUF486 family)
MSSLTIVGVGLLIFMILLALFAHYGRIMSEKRDKTLLIIKRPDLAIELSLKDHCFYSYEYKDGKIIDTTKGRLTVVNSELSSVIESHFGIALKEYGIEVKDKTFRFEN